ncbi:Hypothetical predicted protein [Paramuricea clavata]|uniref:Uncharacterized protein n=1 Tax=Paramuricea clavata TaxID=317549 RepID=A0A7D9L4P4_PARCT|nr:Hypothetical predicted protein [Paramuricea clavata]
MKWAILLLVVLVAISSVSSRRKRKTKRVKNALKYVGCKPEDGICDKRPQRYCQFSRFQYQCPRKCGKCAPFEPKCPKEHVFGCCWDGTAATNIEKSNCPVCSDVNEAICKRADIRKDCNFSKKTRITRFLCPVTCGACGDFGNNRAPAPAHTCEDKDQRCYKMKDTSCCKDNEILRDVCPKTCGVCQSYLK